MNYSPYVFMVTNATDTPPPHAETRDRQQVCAAGTYQHAAMAV